MHQYIKSIDSLYVFTVCQRKVLKNKKNLLKAKRVEGSKMFTETAPCVIWNLKMKEIYYPENWLQEKSLLCALLGVFNIVTFLDISI